MSLVSGVLETLLAFDSELLRYRFLRHCSHKTVKRDRKVSVPLYCLCSTFSRLWPIHPSTYDDGDGYAGGVGLAGGGYGSVVPTGVGVGGTGVGCVTVTDGVSVVAVGCTAGGVCGGGVWVTTIMAGVRVGVGVGVLDMHPPDVSVNTTRVSSIPEVVQEGKTGLLVPPGDVDALAEAILELARHPGRARRMGLAGRQRVRERFSLEKMLEDMEELFSQVIRGQGFRRDS